MAGSVWAAAIERGKKEVSHRSKSQPPWTPTGPPQHPHPRLIYVRSHAMAVRRLVPRNEDR
eukprot:6988839-Prymnesium_polylepis.1